MKNKFKLVFILPCLLLVFACVSTPKGEYKIIIGSGISNPFVQSAWIAYAGHIRENMDKFYAKNTGEEYIISHETEIGARNSLIDFYLRVKKDYKLNDPYIEDLIKIRSAKKLNEYVFFSFNPGNWVNENGFSEEVYTEWMGKNMPEHIPLTLARVEKID